ncbi:hypothetical protein [uncultured Selenomonas sp.]|uniref:hypothetical protein n=1 Tax=uncultured Selenomonas sp. TaxID=159275 RepID=UPI0025F9AE05|nr:hypothetical protein [uncultured Selenomonas sp.]
MYEHMHEDVKKLADAKNVKRLRYVFADCLDVDPSFRKFEDDFQYCRDQGIFEAHEELTPRREDPATWDMDYWVALKGNLLQNLSVERLQHMRDVAKVLFPVQLQTATTATPSLPNETHVRETTESGQTIFRKPITPENDKNAQVKQKIAEAKRELEKENQEMKAREASSQQLTYRRNGKRVNSPKKAEGVPAGMLVPIIIVAAIILYLLLK